MLHTCLCLGAPEYDIEVGDRFVTGYWRVSCPPPRNQSRLFCKGSRPAGISDKTTLATVLQLTLSGLAR